MPRGVIRALSSSWESEREWGTFLEMEDGRRSLPLTQGSRLLVRKSHAMLDSELPAIVIEAQQIRSLQYRFPALHDQRERAEVWSIRKMFQ